MNQQCEFRKIASGTYRCKRCRFIATRIKYLPIWRDCTGKTSGISLAPGDVLSRIIFWAYPDSNAKILGPCESCESRRMKMNQWGWIYCAIKVPTIWRWLKEAAASRALNLSAWNTPKWLWLAIKNCVASYLCPIK